MSPLSSALLEYDTLPTEGQFASSEPSLPSTCAKPPWKTKRASGWGLKEERRFFDRESYHHRTCLSVPASYKYDTASYRDWYK